MDLCLKNDAEGGNLLASPTLPIIDMRSMKNQPAFIDLYGQKEYEFNHCVRFIQKLRPLKMGNFSNNICNAYILEANDIGAFFPPSPHPV